jgi:ATP-binding cassette subfamily B protein
MRASTLSNQTGPSISRFDLTPLLPFLRPYRRAGLAAIIVLVLAAVLTLALPVAVGRVIDEGFTVAGTSSIDQHFVTLFALAALLALFGAGRFYLVSWLGERVVADVRSAVYRHVMTLGPAFFDERRTGEVLSRITTDTTLVQSIAGVNLSISLRSALTLVGALVMLGVTSARLTGVILVLIPLVLIPLIVYGRQVRHLSRTTQDRVADTSAIAAETINAVETVQAYGLESMQSERFNGAVNNAFSAAVQRVRARAFLTAGAILILFGAVVFVLWLGARDVIAGDMTPGQLGQFLLYAVMVAGSAASLSEMWGEIQRATGALERIAELLAAKADIVAPAVPTPLPSTITGAIQLEDVSFAYPTRADSPALKQLNLTVNPGEVLALVGPSGAGKSTVLKLLMRFFDVDTGTIRFDGIDVRELDPSTLREQMALVPQDCVLFAESALENIRYGRPGASDDEVRQAAVAAGADEFITALPDGYTTALGERGARLSGGQRQRVAIARALLRDAPVLLLDEATSALDARSEQLIRSALGRLMHGRTTVVVAHRLSTVKDAHRIAVIDGGQVVELGSHAELMAADGLYAHLANIQLHSDRDEGARVENQEPSSTH